MGKKMAGTNKFACFRCKSICTGGGGGVQNQAEKNSKNAFRPVPVQEFTFPVQPASDLRSHRFESLRFQLRFQPSCLAFFTGKVIFCTGTGRKAFFRIFFGLILDPPPPPSPGTYASTAKKKQIRLYRPFFPIAWPFLKKRGGLVPVYVFLFPVLHAIRGCSFVRGLRFQIGPLAKGL